MPVFQGPVLAVTFSKAAMAAVVAPICDPITPTPDIVTTPTLDDKVLKPSDEKTMKKDTDSQATEWEEEGEGEGEGEETTNSEEASAPAEKDLDPADEGVIAIKFLFANRDDLQRTVTVLSSISILELKEKLLLQWPSDLPKLETCDRLRFICMGKGMLSPDNLPLEQFKLPKFTTHPTPVNVAIRPEAFTKVKVSPKKKGKSISPQAEGPPGGAESATNNIVDEGVSRCMCLIA